MSSPGRIGEPPDPHLDSRLVRRVERIRLPLVFFGAWLVVGSVLSVLTGECRDWFDMTDELRYERLAISIARTHSLIPRIHGAYVQSYSQLYPLLIAPVFASGLVPHALTRAHVLNAWVMSSACIPAYLLARMVTGRRGLAFFVAALSVVMPWIALSTMLMTEVAAYPAAAWALLALYVAILRPSPRNDVLAVGGLALAFLGRTELLVLVLVLPVAIVLFELGAATGPGITRRVAGAGRSALRGHPVLAALYACLAVAAVVAWARGTLASVVGVYGIYTQQSSAVPKGTIGSFATHAAVFSAAFGILPFLVGSAWLLAGAVTGVQDRRRHAFACLGAITVIAVLAQGANFDVRYTGYVHDRFLLYLVPVVLIGIACAIESPRRLLLPLAAVTAVVACGFATGSFPGYTWDQFTQLNEDSLMSGLLKPVVHLTGSLGHAKLFLAGATIVLAAAFVAGSLVSRRAALIVAGYAAAVLTATTAATFDHLFAVSGWSGRPVTASEKGTYDFVDQAVGRNQNVTMIPYLVSSDYITSEQWWRDLEFYNVSLDRDALDPDAGTYAYTGIWFPKLVLAFDPRTGRANMSPTAWVAVSDKDTRFALAGTPRLSVDDIVVVNAVRPWRAQWLSFGLYDDGWTKPGVTARIRIFPAPGQRRARTRSFAFAVRPVDGSAGQQVSVTSNIGHWAGTVTSAGTVTGSVVVCVPAHGWTEIRLRTPVTTQIPGDAASLAQSLEPRRGGVFFGETALAGEIGPPCHAG